MRLKESFDLAADRLVAFEAEAPESVGAPLEVAPGANLRIQ